MQEPNTSLGFLSGLSLREETGCGFSLSVPPSEEVVKFVCVGVAYFLLAFIGLQLASIHPNATPIWAPTGLAIATIVLWGYRISPAVFVAAFLVNSLFEGTILTSLMIACGNTLEALIAIYLIRQLIVDGEIFGTPTNVAAFFCACVAATTISATIGVGALTLDGHVAPDTVLPVWLTWWLGDLAGAVVVAPVILLWAKKGVRLNGSATYQITILYVVSASVALVCFSPLLQSSSFRDVLAFFVVLPLLWAAIRMGSRETATVGLIISVAAILGTLYQGGPFSKPSLNGAFIVLLVFLISIVIPALSLSAEVSTRRRLEMKQRQQSLKAEVLWQVSVQAAAGGSFEELLRTCLQKICQVTGWAAGHIYIPDNVDDPNFLHSSGIWHFEKKSLKPLARDAVKLELRRGQGLPGRIWATGLPIWMSDLAECDKLPRKEFLLRRGFRAAFGFPIYIEGKLHAVLEFFSTTHRQPDEELMLIVKSIGEQLGRVFERKQANEQRAALETTLSALTVAVYFTDRSGRVVYMNDAGKQLAQNGCGFRLNKNLFVPVDQKARVALKNALELVTANAIGTRLIDRIIPIPDEDGGGAIAVVLPLLEGIDQETTSRVPTATAAILVQKSVASVDSMGQAFAQLYGLTRSELRVLLAMSPELSLKQVAHRLGICEATAKTHLQHIYAKTHTARQSELLHLLMCLTPPLYECPQVILGSPSEGYDLHRGSLSQ